MMEFGYETMKKKTDLWTAQIKLKKKKKFRLLVLIEMNEWLINWFEKKNAEFSFFFLAWEKKKRKREFVDGFKVRDLSDR